MLNIEALTSTTPQPGCALWLNGLPGGGDRIYDLSPYGNHGSIDGAVWHRLPSDLWYLKFDGNDKVDCGDNPSLDFGGGDFTITAWLKPDTTGASDNAAIAKYSDANNRWRFYHRGNGSFSFQAIKNSSVLLNIHVSEVLQAEAWQQLAIAVKGSSICMYKNGRFMGRSDDNASGNIDNTGSVELGGVTLGNPWNGSIALPRIHHRAITGLEIQNRFQREKHLFEVW